MQTAVDSGVFPGAVLLVARDDAVLLHEAWGVADSASRRAVTTDTVFDLASLSKPLATAPAAMRLIQAGCLRLEDPMAEILPIMAGTDKAPVTVRQLLSHSSGWPAWRPYFRTLREHFPEVRRERLLALLAAERLTAPPGTKWLYSDLDFLALGLMLEAVSGLRLDRLAAREIYAPLDIRDLFFNPLDEAPLPRPYASTEHCPWRGRVMSGAVHDDNAWVLNGVAGHAGLFGTAAGVWALLSMLLRVYRGQGETDWLSSECVRTLWTRVDGSGWTLGFDTPSAQASASGRHFSPDSVGHLGFTGTSFWVDLRRGIGIVLLTNRVHPCRSNAAIRAFRPRIHDLIMEWLLQGEPLTRRRLHGRSSETVPGEPKPSVGFNDPDSEERPGPPR
jgi:CubicO group peptidase (beta-lactamase class C family)